MIHWNLVTRPQDLSYWRCLRFPLIWHAPAFRFAAFDFNGLRPRASCALSLQKTSSLFSYRIPCSQCVPYLSLVCCRARPARRTTDLNSYPRGMSKLLRRLPAFNGRCELDLDGDILYEAKRFKESGRKV